MDEKKIAEQSGHLMASAGCSGREAGKEYRTLLPEEREAVAFVGNVLAPFFLNDPSKGALDERLAALAALDVEEAAKDWPFAEANAAAQALAAIKEGIASCAEDGGEAMMWEYRRLFVGPASLPVPPWGSVYTDRDCVCFGASTLELRAWMRANGIKRMTDEATPEDHIGLLLALAAWMAGEKPGLLCEFLELHVLPWSDHLLTQMADASTHPFYEGLAQLANVSLNGMGDVFGLEPALPRFYR